MEHPYDKVYLSDVIEEQGKFFERLQDLPEPIDSADFITAYMHGYTRRQPDAGCQPDERGIPAGIGLRPETRRAASWLHAELDRAVLCVFAMALECSQC